MNIEQAKNIYMIGIKGVGMTMLAQYLCQSGKSISGSDTDEVFMTDRVLKRCGIKVYEGYDAENLPGKTDLLIYSSAYNESTNVELARARERGMDMLSYAEALGQVFNNKYGISVIGSHGKTTTTAWLGRVLSQAGLDPSVMVGARVPQFDGTSLIGRSDIMVVEADEYQNKLKYYEPRGVVLTNIDYDHPDFFPCARDYTGVFIDYLKKIPKKGWLVANLDDDIIRRTALVNCRGRISTYALDEAADYVAYDIRPDASVQRFRVKLGNDSDIDGDSADKDLGEFSIRLPGRHNVSNALAVIAAAIELGVELRDIRSSLAGFTGTARRLEEMGGFRGALIVDDYAHHPTEIRAAILAARQKYPKRRLRLVFHPHTFTRTKALLKDFAASFSGVDELIVLDIYGSAREEQGGVHSRDLLELIEKLPPKQAPPKAEYIPTLEQAEEYLRKNIERGDLVLLMGAGDVFRIGESLIE